MVSGTDVVPSRYYAWRHALATGAVGTTEPAWETEILTVFDHHERRYGTQRLQVELWEKGHWVGRQALRTGLRRHEQRVLQLKAFAPRTTDSTHSRRCALNLLLYQPKSTQANRVWGSDITHLSLANGNGVYCCAFQDVCTKQVVGWQVGAAMPEELVTNALQRAFWSQPPTSGLLVHSDRGGQYGGNAYRKLPHDHQALRSQSRRGDCYDNAQAESRWSRLKTEVLEVRERPVFADLADAQVSVADYFDYYNHERLHSSID